VDLTRQIWDLARSLEQSPNRLQLAGDFVGERIELTVHVGQTT
jgi:hypothetical protein